jgi:hypothetical protein
VTELRREFETEEPRKTFNIWIVKPGENSNRGSGISIYDSFFDIRERVMEGDILGFHKKHTFIIQRYIDNPLLISGRKFDIR